MKSCPIFEAMCKKLAGYESVSVLERNKMLTRAIKVAKELAEPRVVELEKELFSLENHFHEFLKQFENLWNEQADESNRWDSLDTEEKEVFARGKIAELKLETMVGKSK